MRKLTMNKFIGMYNAVLSNANGVNGVTVKLPNIEIMSEIAFKNELSINTIRAYVSRFRIKYNITDSEPLDASKFTKMTGFAATTFNATKLGLIKNKSRGSKNPIGTKKDLIEKFKADVIGIDKTLEFSMNEFLDDLGSNVRQVKFIKSHSLKVSIEIIKEYCTTKMLADTAKGINDTNDNIAPNILGTIETNIVRMEEVLSIIYISNNIKSLEELEAAIAKYKKSVEIRDGIMDLMTM